MPSRVLKALDNAKIQLYHFKAIIVAGMGLFSDSYGLFCITPVMTLIGRIYYPDPRPTDHNQDATQLFMVPLWITSTLVGVSLLGTVIGMLVAGYLGDKVGRRHVYGVSLMMMVVSFIGCGFSLSTLTSFVLGTLGVFRLFLGMGIGGDYPLSAIIMSEFANRRTRGQFIAGVFIMQGFGILFGSVVTIVICSIFNAASKPKHTTGEEIPHVPAVADLSWRIILMIGAIPTFLTYYWRTKMPETARFTVLVEKNELQATKNMVEMLDLTLGPIMEDEELVMMSNGTPVSNRESISDSYGLFSHEFFRRHGRDLFAASVNWFLLDLVFYSLNLFQFYAFQRHIHDIHYMNLYKATFQVAKFQSIVAIGFTVPGYFATAFLIDKVGRVPIQFGGFLCMAVCLFTIGKAYPGTWETDPPIGFLVLYGLTFFFSNFGPNTTTFIVPAELFPARFRTTCHGISGAIGKIGAIIGAVGFVWFSRDAKNEGIGIGISNTLTTMGGVCVLGMMVTYFFTRETKERSLEENESTDELTGVWFVRFWPWRCCVRPTDSSVAGNNANEGADRA